MAGPEGAQRIEGLGPATLVPRLVPGKAVASLAIGPEEGFVLSRIDGRTSLGDICQLVPFERALTADILQRLWRAGVIELPGLSPPSPPPSAIARPSAPAPARARTPTPVPTVTRAPAPTPTLSRAPTEPPSGSSSKTRVPDGVDLQPEQVRRIDQYYLAIGQRDAYGLLEIERTADKREMKRAYFRLSKEFHPDRFFAKELGDYAMRLSKIFQALKAAFELLSDDERRAAYDQDLRRG